MNLWYILRGKVIHTNNIIEMEQNLCYHTKISKIAKFILQNMKSKREKLSNKRLANCAVAIITILNR